MTTAGDRLQRFGTQGRGGALVTPGDGGQPTVHGLMCIPPAEVNANNPGYLCDGNQAVTLWSRELGGL